MATNMDRIFYKLGFDRSRIASGQCAKILCENAAGPDDFRDDLSRREHALSGLCQAHQDAIFGELGE